MHLRGLKHSKTRRHLAGPSGRAPSHTLPRAACPLPDDHEVETAGGRKCLERRSPPPSGLSGARGGVRQRGFTLLEVTIACAIFFIAVFAILELTTNSLKAARALQQREPDVGLVAAMLSLTNEIVEGIESGDFEDIYPDMYEGWYWEAELQEAINYEGVILTNLFQADIRVYRRSSKGPAMSTLSIYLYRPDSPPGRGRSSSLGL